MRSWLLVPSVGVLFFLVTACCFMGTPPPPSGGGSGTAPALPTPTAGHTCHLDVSVVFPSTKPTGEAWDVAGGRPDPCIVVQQDGTRIGETDRVQDSMSGHWVLDVACDHARPLVVEAVDRDVSMDDTADTVEIPAGDPSIPGPLRTDTWGMGGVHFDVSVEYR